MAQFSVGVNIDPQRVAALGWAYLGVEHRARIGDRLVFAIGVEAFADPHLARSGAALFNRLGRIFLAGIRDDEDFGIAFQVGAQRLHDVRRTQAAGESDMLLRGHIQPAETQNGMLVPGSNDSIQISIAHLHGRRNVADVGTEAVFKWCDFHYFALREGMKRILERDCPLVERVFLALGAAFSFTGYRANVPRLIRCMADP